MARLLKFALLLLVMLLGLALHARNGQPVQVDYYLGSAELPLSLGLALALLVGALLGVLAALPRLLALGRRCARLEHAMRRQPEVAPPAPVPALPARADDAG